MGRANIADFLSEEGEKSGIEITDIFAFIGLDNVNILYFNKFL